MVLDEPLKFGDGHEIVRFIRSETPAVPVDDADVPLTWALTVPTHKDQYILMHNLNRNQYELPGGAIETGEAPIEAARREVLEETCQRVQGLQFQGLMKVVLQPAGTLEYGAIYTGQVKHLMPFTINDESDQIALWKPGVELDDRVSLLVKAVLQLLEMEDAP